MKLLITGASGLYGNRLAQLAKTKGYEVYSGYNKDKPKFGTPTQFDITNKKHTQQIFQKVQPDTVVHAASLTNVDTCETHKQLAWKTNIQGTKNIVQAAKKNQSFLIFISTDYVFNGEKGNYQETDKPNPINYYGQTKLLAEQQIQTLKNYCIARPSVIYGSTPAANKTNFALWVINQLKNNKPIKIATDQTISPTLNTNLADMTLEIAEQKLNGIYHLSGATPISRLDFTTKIAKTFNLNQNLILPVSINDFSWPAKRPKNSSLNTNKAQKTLSHKPQQIDQALQKLKEELNTTLT